MSSNRLPIFRDRFNELKGDRNQQEFADFLGISRPTVALYSSGERIPDALILNRIADRCGVSADYLLGRTEAATADKDLQFVCDYTGLSLAAVETLRDMFRPDDDWPRPRNVDYLSDFISECGITFSRQLNALEKEIANCEWILSTKAATSLESAEESLSVAAFKFEKTCQQIPARLGIDVDGALFDLQSAMIGGEKDGEHTED